MRVGHRFTPRVKILVINGRRASVRLEAALWEAVDEICLRETRDLRDLLNAIDRKRGPIGLTAAVRLFVVGYFRAAAELETRSWRGFSERPDGESISAVLRAALDSLDSEE